MALEEAGAWLDNDLLLPIGGKKYRVVEYDAATGVRVEVLLNSSSRESDRYRQVLSDQEERDLYRDVLGGVYDELLADQVSFGMLKTAALTAMYHFNFSPETAERHWNSVVAPGKAKGTAASSRPGTRRTTGAATTTKPRASSSGTRPRRNS